MHAAVLIFLTFWTLTSVGAGLKTDVVAARASMLEMIEESQMMRYDLRIEKMESATPKKQALIKIYTENYWPYFIQLQRLLIEMALTDVFVDRALFKDDEEKELFFQKRLELGNKFQEIATDKNFLSTIKKMYALSVGQRGGLASEVRSLYEAYVKTNLGPRDLVLLYKINALENEILKHDNGSPLNPVREKYDKLSKEALLDFQSDRISLKTYSEAMLAIERMGPNAHGSYLAKAARKTLRELAVLRSELAARKGHTSWAEYTLKSEEEEFSKGFKTPQERIRFLREALTQTKASHRKVLEYLLAKKADPNLNLDRLSIDQIFALNPSLDWKLDEFFPAERNYDLWRSTMVESGFSEEIFSRIIFDSDPRPFKHHHAYSMRVVDHYPQEFTINAATLNFRVPKNESRWHKGRAFIVQNFYNGGTEEASTNFHEGGHALEGLHQEDINQLGTSSSYDETHSTLMEHFIFSDEEFLVQKPQSLDGRHISRELAREYIRTKRIERLMEWRRLMLYALFDLELWNSPFERRGEDYVERSRRIFRELWEEFFFGDYDAGTELDPGDRMLATNHFYEGKLAFIGYVYASFAADMSLTKILDNFAAQDRPRSLTQQPTLAQMLIKGFYRSGFNYPFPQSIERFTRRRYTAGSMVQIINQKLEEFVKSSRGRVRPGVCRQIF